MLRLRFPPRSRKGDDVTPLGPRAKMADMARPNAKSQSRDMVISMAVLLVPLLVIIWLFTDNPEPQAEAVDVAPQLARAEAESPYPILRANNLPEPWKPVRVAWAADGENWMGGEPADGNSWLVGYLGPDGIYYGVQQKDRNERQFIADVTRDGEPTGESVEALDLVWEAYESGDGRTTSLVARDGEVVSIVAADTDLEAVEAFVTSLTTQ